MDQRCRHTPGCTGEGDHVCTVEEPPPPVDERTRRLATYLAVRPSRVVRLLDARR